MRKYIGIDLGTSGVKILLVEADGMILAEVTENYPTFNPYDNWSEQNPEDWWQAVKKGLKKIICNIKKDDIEGISFSGQMHGLVLLDEENKIIRPCILWNDGRTEVETNYLNNIIGKNKISKYTGNIAFAGFTAPKILWVKNNEPQNFKKIKKILLPKDYIAYKLSGNFGTDYTDASGTLLLDVKEKRWSEEMCAICGINLNQLPKLYESYNVLGNLKDDIANELSLKKTIKIIMGAADNAAAAIGTGTIQKGKCNISLGTSGTVFLSNNSFAVDKENALHSFCHADGNWYLMGCILSASACRKWWLEDVLESDDYNQDEEDINKVETNDLVFLPYLNGERCPYNDVKVKGAFLGLTSSTTKGQMSKAILEGVAFALKDCLEEGFSVSSNLTSVTICGGGSKSKEWCKVVSNVLNLPISILKNEFGASFGAAMIAMIGCREYDSFEEIISKLVSLKVTYYPEENVVKKYIKKYSIYKKGYPLLKDFFS